MDICGGVGMIPASYFAIIDNFYSSYYKAVIKHIDLKDKTIIKNISLTMLKERGKVCPNTKFDDNVSSGLNSALAAQCYYYPYNKALRDITRVYSLIILNIKIFLNKSFIRIQKVITNS